MNLDTAAAEVLAASIAAGRLPERPEPTTLRRIAAVIKNADAGTNRGGVGDEGGLDDAAVRALRS